MEVNFKTLTLQNYKSHQDITVNFGERTDITGDNAKGKTSVSESIAWLFYGTDPFGSKFDPTPVTYESDETKVSMLLKVDGKDLLLGRSLKEGKAAYHINEVPSKATEFNGLIEQLFDKELFLSLFNPNYFFTLHWEKQRAMLLKYVTAPLNKEILKHMPDGQAVCLETLLKKNSLADIEKIHKEKKNSLDKKYIQAQTRTKTLKEQADKLEKPSAPVESLKIELNELIKQRNEIEKVTDSAGTNNGRMNVLQNQIRNMLEERNRMKADFTRLKEEQIEDTCRVCKQPLKEESVAAVEAEKQKRIEEFKAKYNKQVEKRKELEAELAGLTFIDVSEQLEKVRNIQNEINQRESEIRSQSQYEKLNEEVLQAADQEKETHKELKDAIFTLDSIKAFKAKEAELQADKVQALFTTLSVRLFEQVKTTGEFKPAFEIEMDGKPYSKLSLSEGIRAGLELREVLSQQSELIVPVFIDNGESITKFKEPSGQYIVSRVVAGQELKIEGVNKE